MKDDNHTPPKARKRSRKVRLALMGAAGAGGLVACSESMTEAEIFSSIENCLDAGYSQIICEDEFKRAQEMHAEVAPRYVSQADCEADFGEGQCATPAEQGAAPQQEQQQAGGGMGSFFMPLMMGYLAGSMMSGGRGVTQPLYRGRDDGAFRTANNKFVGRGVGRVGIPSSLATTKPNPPSRAISRGGFGASAARRASSTRSSSRSSRGWGG